MKKLPVIEPYLDHCVLKLLKHPKIPHPTLETAHLPLGEQLFDWDNVLIGLQMGRTYSAELSGQHAILSSPLFMQGVEDIELTLNGAVTLHHPMLKEKLLLWKWENCYREMPTFVCTKFKEPHERIQGCNLISCECHRKALDNYYRAGRVIANDFTRLDLWGDVDDD